MRDKKKVCDYCKKIYPESFFGIAATRATKIYRRRKCSKCYHVTKKKLRQKYIQWINNYKREHGCGSCGITDARVLDFHHTKDQNKLFTIDGFRHSLGFKRIEEEVKKCNVVCANCHRILHDEERKNKSRSVV